MADLTEALRQFDATEANLKRLEDLWVEIEKLIPAGMVRDTSSPDAVRYADLCRTFRHIRKALPKVDGFELNDDLLDLDTIFTMRFDATDIALDVDDIISIERRIYSQKESVQEYRFRFMAQRRALVRSALERLIREADTSLARLARREGPDAPKEASGEDWERFKKSIQEIDVLKGTFVEMPSRWNDLHRHIAFAQHCDLLDIIQIDWPAVKPALEAALYGPTDPIPVEVQDLVSLVKAAPTGPVVIALNWDSLDAGDFERLVFNLVSHASGYSNANWLMHTNAPDRGRDLSVERVSIDPLSGTRTARVIVQCKHWPRKSVGVNEVSCLLSQVELWEPPRVDEIIIATTGQFTADAVTLIEKRSYQRQVPIITMWSDKHLEVLLAARPHLVAEFRLR